MKRISCLLLAVCLLLLTGCTENDTDIQTYEAFAAENGVMPALDGLGSYLSVKTLYHREYDFFESRAYTLVAAYDAEHFVSVAEKTEQDYAYQQSPMTDKVGENTLAPEFSLDGYDFRTLALNIYSRENSEFPEELYFIGINREQQKIAYVYFYDPDLDETETLSYLLTEYCGWDRIK